MDAPEDGGADPRVPRRDEPATTSCTGSSRPASTGRATVTPEPRAVDGHPGRPPISSGSSTTASGRDAGAGDGRSWPRSGRRASYRFADFDRDTFTSSRCTDAEIPGIIRRVHQRLRLHRRPAHRVRLQGPGRRPAERRPGDRPPGQVPRRPSARRSGSSPPIPRSRRSRACRSCATRLWLTRRQYVASSKPAPFDGAAPWPRPT